MSNDPTEEKVEEGEGIAKKAESRRAVKSKVEQPKVVLLPHRVEREKTEGPPQLPSLHRLTMPIASRPSLIDEISLPRQRRTPLSIPIFHFTSFSEPIFIKPPTSGVSIVKVSTPVLQIPKLEFQLPPRARYELPLEITRLPRPLQTPLTIPPLPTLPTPQLAAPSLRDECKVEVRRERPAAPPTPIARTQAAPEASEARAPKVDVMEALKERGVENLLELLLSWPNEEELKSFLNTLSSPNLMCIFLVPAPSQRRFPGELVIRKTLATEYKRVYGDIGAQHDTPSDLSDKSKHVITFTSSKVDRLVEYAIKAHRVQ
jgi:hypothetical protein